MIWNQNQILRERLANIPLPACFWLWWWEANASEWRNWVLENVPQQQRSKGWFLTREGDVQGKGDASHQLRNGHSEASGLPEWLRPNLDTMLPEWEISWSSSYFLAILCQNIIFYKCSLFENFIQHILIIFFSFLPTSPDPHITFLIQPQFLSSS